MAGAADGDREADFAVFMQELDRDGKGLISGALGGCRELGKALHEELSQRIGLGRCECFPPGSTPLDVVREANGSDPQGLGVDARPSYWGIGALSEALTAVESRRMPGLDEPEAVMKAAGEADDALLARLKALGEPERESFLYPREMLGGSLDRFSPEFLHRLSQEVFEICRPHERGREGWVWPSDVLADGSPEAEAVLRDVVERIADGSGSESVRSEAGALLERMDGAREAAASRGRWSGEASVGR